MKKCSWKEQSTDACPTGLSRGEAQSETDRLLTSLGVHYGDYYKTHVYQDVLRFTSKLERS